MVGSLQSLSNMEYALYGNYGGLGRTNTPSMYNNYCLNSPQLGYISPTTFGQIAGYAAQNYPYNSQSATADTFTASSNQSQQNQASFTANPKDVDKVANYYMKNMTPTETILGAAGGGVVFGVMNNMRWILHPYNATKGAFAVRNSIFKDIKTAGSTLNKLWVNQDTHRVIADAYGKMHKLETLSPELSRLGIFKKKLDKPVYDALKTEMEAAIKSGDVGKIAEASEKIGVATKTKTAGIGKLWSKIRGKETDVAKRLANEEASIKANAAKTLAENTGTLTLSKSIKHAFTPKKFAGSAALWIGMELLMGLGNIKNAFSKDKKTGVTQIGQTLIKGAGSAVGWTLGESIGAVAGAKIGATLGTAIAPGVGTAIGAICGVVGGSLGMWLTSKITKKLVGEDVGAKVEVENMKKTPDGQVKLLQLTAQQKEIPQDVQLAMQNIMTQYQAAAEQEAAAQTVNPYMQFNPYQYSAVA